MNLETTIWTLDFIKFWQRTAPVRSSLAHMNAAALFKLLIQQLLRLITRIICTRLMPLRWPTRWLRRATKTRKNAKEKWTARSMILDIKTFFGYFHSPNSHAGFLAHWKTVASIDDYATPIVDCAAIWISFANI